MHPTPFGPKELEFAKSTGNEDMAVAFQSAELSLREARSHVLETCTL